VIGRLRRPQSIPLADANELARHARRTALVRIGLAAALLAALATEVSFGRDPEKRTQAVFPGGKSGVLVLDMSASVGSPGRRFSVPLRHLARTKQDFGLVLFSDVAYEAIPPGTSSAELSPYISRFAPPVEPCFTPPGWTCPPGTRRMSPTEQRRRRAGGFRRKDPWAQSFRGGTRISTGLVLARKILEREGMARRGVLLVSDLDDSLFDLPALTRELITYRRREIPLHLVAVSPFEDDRLYFRRMLGRDAFVSRADLAPRGLAGKSVRETSSFPIDLVLIGLLVLLLLGANEHYCGRLTWRRVGEPGGRS
jgi:hypothetical protein